MHSPSPPSAVEHQTESATAVSFSSTLRSCEVDNVEWSGRQNDGNVNRNTPWQRTWHRRASVSGESRESEAVEGKLPHHGNGIETPEEGLVSNEVSSPSFGEFYHTVDAADGSRRRRREMGGDRRTRADDERRGRGESRRERR